MKITLYKILEDYIDGHKYKSYSFKKEIELDFLPNKGTSIFDNKVRFYCDEGTYLMKEKSLSFQYNVKIDSQENFNWELNALKEDGWVKS